MFNFSEILFICVLALLLIGPKQLPEVARKIGRMMNEFRRASDTLFSELKKPPTSGKELLKELTKDSGKDDRHS